jgi:hypothetical protein
MGPMVAMGQLGLKGFVSGCLALCFLLMCPGLHVIFPTLEDGFYGHAISMWKQIQTIASALQALASA